MSSNNRHQQYEWSDWEEQFRKTVPRVYRYFAYKVGNVKVAEDLTGDTFEKAWRNRKQYQSDRGAWADWVLGIAHNVAVDYFRQRKKHDGIESEATEGQVRPVEETHERHSEFLRLSVLLSRLDHRERELIALKYGGEMTNRAIAKLTGLSESNVGTILHRIVSAFRQEWEKPV